MALLVQRVYRSFPLVPVLVRFIQSGWSPPLLLVPSTWWLSVVGRGSNGFLIGQQGLPSPLALHKAAFYAGALAARPLLSRGV